MSRGRGARIWQAGEKDLFDWSPPPPPPPPPPRAPRLGITDAEARIKEKAIERFKFWLLAASIEDLEAADPGALAEKYPPLEAADLRQMIEVRIRGQRKKAK